MLGLLRSCPLLPIPIKSTYEGGRTGDALVCSLVITRLMFGEGTTLSSKSHVSSARSVRKPGVPETVFLRMPEFVAGLLPDGRSECCPPEVVRRSRAEAVLEGGVGNGSNIWQSVGNVGVGGCAWDLPLS
jgi:hypothetical protein